MNPAGPAVLITGANRGIGLSITKELIKLPSIEHVFACCRTPDKADDLNQVAKNDNRVQVVKLNVQSDEDLQKAVRIVEETLGEKGLNVLINNAAILTETGANYKNPDRNILQEHMNVNIVAPIVISAAFLPLLRKDSSEQKPSLIVNISSDCGSIKNAINIGTAWGNVAYGITKAGLNQYTRYMSLDEGPNHIVTVSIHPGWLRTDMGSSAAPESVEEGTQPLIQTLQHITVKDNGRFMDRYGKDMNF